MTVRQLILGLSHYDQDLKVYFSVPGEQGRIEEHWPVNYFDVKYSERSSLPYKVLLKPYSSIDNDIRE
jgi:hypothetical protein